MVDESSEIQPNVEEQVNPTDQLVAGPQMVTEEQPVVQEPQEETSADRNFRALRELKTKAEQERDDAYRKLQQYEQEDNLPYEDEQYDKEPDPDIKDDDLVEGRHFSKMSKKMRKLEQQVQDYQQKTSVTTAEARLKSQYPDFDKVVSKENIDILTVSYPELANTLNSGTDIYSTAVSAYTMIKKMGIYTENPYEQDKALAQKNNAKPRTLASVAPQHGDSPMSRANMFANGLTEELKKQLYKEMVECSRKC